MSFARTSTVTFRGAAAQPVDVQVQIAAGLPSFTIVGLANKAISESRERVRAALSTIGVALPPKRVLVNLAPADVLKDGSHFDLPIAAAILAALGLVPPERLAECTIMGGLSLDGQIVAVPGILPGALAAAEAGRTLICPASQGAEAAWAGAPAVWPVATLGALVAQLRGTEAVPPPEPPPPEAPAPLPDFADITGQHAARRAAEIAAAGGHNILFVGPPGSGKSMIAERLPGLLPPLSAREALEVAVIRSLSGLFADGRIPSRRPFRAPHHSASLAALVGGGARVRPGEISLAHHGVLFLDELPEFPRNAIEGLRQPLETGEVAISRASEHVTFPAAFQLVAAMNPCRCGLLGVAGKECGRAPDCGAEYRQKLSGPLLDRIDMVVEMTPVPSRDMVRGERGEPTAAMAARVAAAHAFGQRRGLGRNAALPAEALRAMATDAALATLERAGERFGLSSRALLKVLRVARSIADLAGRDAIDRAEVAEALSYRARLG
jgi:magnesium chelatase family protein